MKRRITACLVTFFIVLTFLYPSSLSFGITKTQVATTTVPESFTLSVEAFSVGLGYLVEPIKIPLEEGKTTSYYVDRILSQHSLVHNGGDPSNEFFYISAIRGSALANPLSLPDILKQTLSSVDPPIPFDETHRIDDSALTAGDVTASSGWMVTTNNACSDLGMGQEIPSAGDVIRLQFSSVGWGMDLGTKENEWMKPYFGTIDKDALTETIAELLTHPDKESLLNKEDVHSFYRQALQVIQQMDADPSELNRIQQALHASLHRTSPPLDEVEATWKNFRGSDGNMAIRNDFTPISTQGSQMKWVKRLGNDWTDCPSAPILVDQSMVTMSGNKLYQLDLGSGAVKRTVTMMGKPSTGAHIPPIYVEGMIVVALDGGILQAFSAKTLEPLWIYTDSLGGQALSHITYSNGYLYTGFWNSSTEEANFVCLSTAIENVKEPVWTFTHTGGFYWTGAVIVGDAVIVGSDSGTLWKDGNETSHLYAFHKYTGEVLSDIDGIIGDQRSAIAYDEENDSVYFTTKTGYLYSAKVNKETGAITNVKGLSYGEGLQSTSTPVVYKGRVYFGLSDQTFTVSDAKTLEPIYKVKTKGYPQCSFLLSTAYEEESGYLYFYGTYNTKPGGLTMIRTKSDAVSAEDAFIEELYLADGYGNYCVDSVICGSDGTLYYKNDSCHVFAIARINQKDEATPSPSNAPSDVSGSNDSISNPSNTKVHTTIAPTPTAKRKSARPNTPKSILAKYKKNKRNKAYTITLSWKKAKNAKGYEVYVSTKKNGRYKLDKIVKKKSFRMLVYKKGKYYFKIRSYSIYNKKKIYSPFSKKIIKRIQ